MFRRRQDPPAESLAQAEQTRADGLARRLASITEDPHHPSRSSLTHYQDAYRDASTRAAEHTEQPRKRPRR